MYNAGRIRPFCQFVDSRGQRVFVHLAAGEPEDERYGIRISPHKVQEPQGQIVGPLKVFDAYKGGRIPAQVAE